MEEECKSVEMYCPQCMAYILLYEGIEADTPDGLLEFCSEACAEQYNYEYPWW